MSLLGVSVDVSLRSVKCLCCVYAAGVDRGVSECTREGLSFRGVLGFMHKRERETASWRIRDGCLSFFLIVTASLSS